MLFLAFLSFLAFGSLNGESSGGFPVVTTSGNVLGHPATNRTSVTEFLGIRYGQAAIGTLRFQPPISFNSSLTYAAEDYVRYPIPTH